MARVHGAGARCGVLARTEIDAYFNKMDSDGGGSLDFPELKTALRALKDASIRADRAADGLNAQASALREKAGFVQE